MESYICLVLLPVCLSVTSTHYEQGCCEKSPEKLCLKCCNNYLLINGTCYECDPGRWNKNCSDLCVYPYYGDLCISVCDCDPHLCHTITGCSNEAPNTTETSLVEVDNKLKNIVQSRNKNGEPISNIRNISHLQIILLVGGTALGCCILTIILLVIIIIRRQQTGRDLDADYHELRMLRLHMENNERRRTAPVEMNTYKSICTLSKPRSFDSSGSHCYQDIPEYTTMGRNVEEREQEGGLDMGSCYQKIEASNTSDESYERPVFMLPA
ncbi:uncharacterized protein LOC134255811 [Saccostrea cucullata]|uniref:uncharacterized protein LOC134255811 n=1 Tax=Saccostrea cuccullata TaxID=36930 RepID=UPI002ED0C7EA